MIATCKLGAYGCWNDGKCRATCNCIEKVITKGDIMRTMSDEELAIWLCSRFDDCSPSTCPGANYCNGTDGKANGLVKWLKQPAED